MYYPSEKEFLNLSKKGNVIPVYAEILGDTETPVSAYYKLASKSPHSFLLESVEGEEKVARFSFLSRDPQMVIESKNGKAKVHRFDRSQKRSTAETFIENPLDLLRKHLKTYKFVDLPGLPRFCGGFVGYLSYDTVRFFEKLPRLTKDDLKLPDMMMMLAKNLIIFDHINHRIKVISCAQLPDKTSDKQKINEYKKAVKEIQAVIADIKKPLALPKKQSKTRSAQFKTKSNMSKAQFMKIVDQGKGYIQKGDIIQVVLSQRFEVDLKQEPFYIYRTLRGLNPSPYMYYLSFGDIKIVGSSPELLVRCENGVVETRPIAGTRKRGVDDKEDASLAKDLLSDPKERAEHLMLVDLGRNDLGRVCERGTVEVSEFMRIEKYSHVMHIVSDVKGKLRKDKDPFDVLQAAFPAGTVSGAPKIRAMEIIEELENVSRGPYAGCIGYFSFSGNLDTCITIRTIVVKANKAYVQAGAGIVADSDPRTEYQETVNKAKAQIRAIELAQAN